MYIKKLTSVDVCINFISNQIKLEFNRIKSSLGFYNLSRAWIFNAELYEAPSMNGDLDLDALPSFFSMDSLLQSAMISLVPGLVFHTTALIANSKEGIDPFLLAVSPPH